MSCTRCKPIYHGRKPATAVADGNKLVITLKHFCPEVIVQGDRVSFYIPCCFDYPSTKIADVEIVINGTTFDAMRFGAVKWDQVTRRVCYTIVLGTEDLTATFLNDLPPSKYDYPVYSTTCTTSEETDEVAASE